jgi:hypothetical protein
MSANLFQTFQESSTPQRLISACEKIINKNNPSHRVKEIIPIILGKKQLILDDNNKDQQQQMIESVGDLFLWLIPKTPNHPEELKIEGEIRAAARAFCATPEVEAFFLEVMIPNAFEEDAIVATARAVCSLVAFDNKRKLFTSQFAARQLLEMAVRAPTQLSLDWSLGAIENITFDADDSIVELSVRTRVLTPIQGYVTKENAQLLLQAFQRAEDETCLERAAEFLSNVSSSSSGISQICTEEFASAVLDKLSSTESTVDVSNLFLYLFNAGAFQPDFSSFFCTEDAAKILLRASELVNDNDSATFFCFAIENLVSNIEDEPLNFATQEFCVAIVKCFDFAETDNSRHRCAGAISSLPFKCKSACPISANILNIAEKLHDAIKNTKDPNEGSHLFDAIANICTDDESARPFANVETLQFLIDSRKKVTDNKTLKSIDFVMNNIVLQFPEFLDFCAAQSDASSEHQRQLLRVETLEELATFLKNDFFALLLDSENQIFKRRSLLIICEKLDQFILSREENDVDDDDDDGEFQNFLMHISINLLVGRNDVWEEILNHQFLDTVVFSLLQHGNGATCRVAADLVLQRSQRPNPPALSSSILKVILEKMDEEDEETFFEEDENEECFFSVGIQFLRHAVSKDSRDLSKSFVIDNLNLLNRVFFKGYLFGDSDIQEEISGAIEEIRKFDPRMTHAPQILIKRESGQRRDRDGNPSTKE